MYTTRFAPSPTGDLHIGSVRTAYHNWLLARATGGRFILRIDDTDRNRSDPAHVQTILDILAWLDLGFDAVFYQSRRLDRYREALQEVPHLEKDGAVLLDLNPTSNLPQEWHDEVVGNVRISPNDLLLIHHSVLMKADGTPSYNWACVVDDHDLGINYVLRGSDHITNTSKQIVLYYAWDKPAPAKFAHVGLIAQKGKLLSKRDGTSSMLHYKNAGYDPDAVLNFLVRMGWSPKVDDKTTKLLPRERMLELFVTGGNLRSSLANADLDKLEALDRKYKALKGVWRNRDKLMET